VTPASGFRGLGLPGGFYAATGRSSGVLHRHNAAHLNRLSTAPLVPAAGCTTSCHAIAVLSGVTAGQLGGSGSHDVIACFSGDGANDAPSYASTTVNMDHPWGESSPPGINGQRIKQRHMTFNQWWTVTKWR
jgi:hypothetical protein